MTMSISLLSAFLGQHGWSTNNFPPPSKPSIIIKVITGSHA